MFVVLYHVVPLRCNRLTFLVIISKQKFKIAFFFSSLPLSFLQNGCCALSVRAFVGCYWSRLPSRLLDVYIEQAKREINQQQQVWNASRRHAPFLASVFSGGPMMHGGAANPMMMNRLGGGPPHFRPGMLTPQQQQQYMQQQRQMMAACWSESNVERPDGGDHAAITRTALFPPNSHLGHATANDATQMMNKSAGLMPPPNAGSSQPFDPQNTSIFGKQQVA
uniref:Uncharacterized protein n=1 Tax=Ditylenchus dipsaci TaxID=166011 RepID=A0A915EKX1_9BILA